MHGEDEAGRGRWRSLCLWLSTAPAEGPTVEYYRTVIRDSYPGWPSIRAKAALEVSVAIKLRRAPWNLSSAPLARFVN